MSNVIEFRGREPKPEKPTWNFTIAVSNGGELGEIIDFNHDDGFRGASHRLREFSKMLFTTARHLHDHAERLDEQTDGDILAVVIVFESSLVRFWQSQNSATEEQCDWMRERMADASGLVAPLPQEGG